MRNNPSSSGYFGTPKTSLAQLEDSAADPMLGIMQILVRQPTSQKDLTQAIGLSKSRVNYYIKNLLDLGVIKVLSCSSPAQLDQLLTLSSSSAHKSQKLLQIVQDYAYCIRVIHAEDEFVLDLFTLGQTDAEFDLILASGEPAAGQPALSLEQGMPDRVPLATVVVEEQSLRSSQIADCVEHTAAAVDYALSEVGISREQVKLILFATKGSLEQGYAGYIYRDNVLRIQPEQPVALAEMLSTACGIPAYVCNYAFGHVLAIYNQLKFKQSHASAITLMCGGGSVALGIVLEGRILFGPHQSFLECAHFPYLYGFEQSLGQYGAHTADALYYAIRILCPIFGISHVIVAGQTFSGHEDVLSEVKHRLSLDPEQQIQRIYLDYQERSIERHRNELTLFACEQSCALLKLKPILRDLATFAGSFGEINL